MKKTIDKKNFCVNGKEYTVVYGSRVYIEYYNLVGSTRIRVKRSGGINRIKSKEEQLAFAKVFIQNMNGSVVEAESNLMNTLIEHASQMRHSTYLSYRVRVNKFLDWLKLNNIQESEVNREVAKKFLLHLSNIGRSNTTIQSYTHSLGAIYRRYDENVNPFYKALKVRVQKKSLMHFNANQKELIKEYINSNGMDLMLLAINLLYTTFIRPKEMRFLRFSNLDFENSHIEIPDNISKNGKSQKVKMPDTFIEQYQYLKIFPKDKFVFGTKQIGGDKPVGNNHFNNLHRKILKELGIQGNYAFYSWKHTGAFDAVKQGLPLKDLQMQLRHHSLDQLNEYLKNLGIDDCEMLKTIIHVL